eukprot:Skav226066  [mRNA]  locus=scaffold211:569345:573190:- [translate_table: standard]
MLFPETLLQCRLLKPEIILIENVVGFSQHDHYQYVLRTMQHIGYKVFWSGTVELAHMCPVKRPRWLAILIRVGSDQIEEVPMQLLATLHMSNPIMFKSVITQPSIDFTRLQISPEVRKILSDPRFSPHVHAGKRRKVSPEDVWLERCHSGWETLPCFLASYGSQHKMIATNKDRQVLTHLAAVGGSNPRYWHPIEILMHHMAVGDTMLPADFHESWRALGNQIAVPHAALLIHNTLRLLKNIQWDHDWSDILTGLRTHRISTDTGIIETSDLGFWVTVPSVPKKQSDQSALGNLAEILEHGASFMPDGMWWDLEGFHSLSSCLPTATWSQITLTQKEDEDAVHMDSLHIFVPVKIQFAQGTLSAWALSTINPADIITLWDSRLAPVSAGSHEDCEAAAISLAPIDTKSNLHSEQKVIPCWRDGKLVLMTISPQMKVKQALEDAFQCEIFDAFGPLYAHTAASRCFGCQDFPTRHMTAEDDPTLILTAFQAAVVTFDYEVLHDSWNIHVKASSDATDTLIKLYTNCMHPEDVAKLGRTLDVERTAEGATLSFRPVDNRVPVPPAAWAMHIAVSVTRAVFAMIPLTTPCPIKLKWEGRPLWEGCLDWDLSAQVIESLLQVCLAPVMHFTCFRLVSRGRQLFTKLGDLIATNDPNPIAIHAIPEVWGGGGPTGAKCQHRQQTKNSVAASLLEQGYELGWIQKHVDTMIDTLGIAAVVPAVGQPPGTIRHARIAQLFSDASIPLPKPTKGVYTPQTLRTKQRRKTLANPDPMDYRINVQYLQNEDGSSTQQIGDLRGHSTGVFLADRHSAMPFLNEGAKLSPDELGMIVMGHIEDTPNMRGEKVVIPCIDKNEQQVLVHGTLFQMGEKSIRIKAWQATKVTSSSSKVCSITLWANEWTPQEWQHATSKTNIFIKEVLMQEQMDHAIEGCWGRSLRKGKQVASVHDATSLQIHASVSSSVFAQFLAASGFNKLWAAPKEDGQLSSEYRVLWMPHLKQDLGRLNAVAAQISNMSGLVKGRNSLGIRVLKTNFAEAWKKVFPDDEPPIDVPSSLAFKLEPLPHGTNPSQLREWAAAVGWTLRPVRPLGPKTWLVTCGEKPPNEILAWNGQPILPIPLPSRFQQERQSAIVAGPRARKENGPKDTTLPPLAGDPWASFVPSNSARSASSTATPATQAVRAIQGPAEQKFQAQDARLSTLEEKMEKMMQSQGEQQQHIQRLENTTAGIEHRLSSQLNQAVDNVKNELSQSFSTAIKQQSQAFDSSIRELKNLLLQSKRKQQAKGEDEMSS